MRTPAIFLLLAGCLPPRSHPLGDLLKQLSSADRAERSAAFQQLLQASTELAPVLKPFVALGPEHGHPLVAVLYKMGEGDAVPLDLRARHYARFVWPEEHRKENELLEPFITREIEHDLIRAGPPATRHLAAAFDGGPHAERVRELMFLLESPAGTASPEELSSLREAIAQSRPEAPEAHRTLEQRTGMRFARYPAPDLALRWKRVLESPLLRFRLAVLGPAETEGPWTQEKIFPAVETLQAGGGRAVGDLDYLLFLYMDEQGTRLLIGEYATDERGTRGGSRDLHFGAGFVGFKSELLDSWIVMTMEELPARPAPSPPAEIRKAVIEVLRARLPDPEATRALEAAERVP